MTRGDLVQVMGRPKELNFMPEWRLLRRVKEREEKQMHLLSRISVTLTGLFIFGLGGQTVVMADTVSFVGSRVESLPAPTVTGRCTAPALMLVISPDIGLTGGTSNLGAFTAEGSACLTFPFPVPIEDGIFTFMFEDGDTLFGTFSGEGMRVITPEGRFISNTQTYVVTGGTGDFAGATGGFFEIGKGMSTGVSAVTNYTFEGTITAPGLVAVPEPGTLVLLSTSLLGMAVRLQRGRKTRASSRDVDYQMHRNP
jgi:hypothetical protein